MASYDHRRKAGNAGDLIKHALLTTLLLSLPKRGPRLFIDTHAGAGEYPRSPARRRRVDRLPSGREAPGCLKPWLERLRSDPGVYPGSPRLLQAIAARDDRLHFCEIESAPFRRLEAVFADDPRVTLHHGDGFRYLPRLLPEASLPAGLVLIDPPYLAASDYQRAGAGLATVRRAWPGAGVAVWYPLLDGDEGERFGVSGALRAELRLRAPEADGLAGAGLLVSPAPSRSLEEVLTWLAERLGADPRLAYT